jgi:hypothetical protein
MKVKFSVGVGFVNCVKTHTVTIPDDDIEGLDQAGIERMLDNELDDWMQNYIEAYWEIVK